MTRDLFLVGTVLFVIALVEIMVLLRRIEERR